MEPFCVRLLEAIAKPGAPFTVSIRECGKRSTGQAVLAPEAFRKIYPLEMSVGTLGLGVKKSVDAGESLVRQGNQAVAGDHADKKASLFGANAMGRQNVPVCFVTMRMSLSMLRSVLDQAGQSGGVMLHRKRRQRRFAASQKMMALMCSA